MKTYDTYSDNQLLHLLAADDQEAFTEIYSRYWKDLLAIGIGRLKDVQLAEDILHDVFASLWANRNQSHMNSLGGFRANSVTFNAVSQNIWKTLLH